MQRPGNSCPKPADVGTATRKDKQATCTTKEAVNAGHSWVWRSGLAAVSVDQLVQRDAASDSPFDVQMLGDMYEAK